MGSGINIITGENYYTNNLGRIGIYENVNGTTTNLIGSGLKKEHLFQAGLKYALNQLHINFKTIFGYHTLRGNEQLIIYDNTLMIELSKDVTTKMDVWSFQTDVDFTLDYFIIKPFITALFNANYFDDLYIEIAEPNFKSEFSSYDNGLRFGCSAGIGFAYNIFYKLNLEITGNYNAFNIFGKRDGEQALNSISIEAMLFYQIP